MNTYTDDHTETALALISVCLGLDPDPESQDRADLLRELPQDATFTLRRDVEYLGDDDNWVRPDWAAPQGSGWQRSGDEDLLESDWVGSEQRVRAYRWDLFSVDLETLAELASANLWDANSAEMLAGYLDETGVHPACQILSDSMDWNVGGWSPVFIVADYLVID
jgi:hypothetical protein